jgi:uncharacterized protein
MAEQPQQKLEPLVVHHEDTAGEGAFFVERGGERLGELAYTRPGPGRVVIEHTSVSDVLSGQGVARQLVVAAVAWARESGVRLEPVCTYAKKVLERDPSFRDVLG